MVDIISYREEYRQKTLDLVLGILHDEIGAERIDRPDLDDIPRHYQSNDGNFWVAVEGGNVVGTIGLLDYGSNGYLRRLYVEVNHRRTGLGLKLLQTSIEHARPRFRKLYLGTNPDRTEAKKLVERERFIKIGALPEGLPTFGDTEFYLKNL